MPVWAIDGPFTISLKIEREGESVFTETTSTLSLVRRPADLILWLYDSLSFPDGAVLLTGTGIVPDDSFTLQADDVVTITIEGVGTVTNRVETVGA